MPGKGAGARGPSTRSPPPITPDGRYIVVRGRLWRAANPHLPTERRQELVRELMDARRGVGLARRSNNREAEDAAHAAVHAAKVGLGERGAPWWTDGAPDLNRRMARNTIYAEWYRSGSGGDAPDGDRPE